MRQQRWLELLNNYEYEINYHPGEANVVANTLSQKERAKPRRVRALTMTIQSNITSQILDAQMNALTGENISMKDLRGMEKQLEFKENEERYT